MARKRHPIDFLFPAVRQGVLAATLMDPHRWWYMSDLAKHLRLRPSSLQRELDSLVGAGILRRRRDGNRVYFQPETECPFLIELQGLVTKTVGLVDVLRDTLTSHASRIEWAFVYGSLARSEERSTSDVDLMIIGEIELSALAPSLMAAEQKIDRPVNATIYSRSEFVRKASGGHHFLQEVLAREKLFILGRGHELEETLRIGARATAHDRSS